MPVGVTITFNKQASYTYAYAPLALQICHQHSHTATAPASKPTVLNQFIFSWECTEHLPSAALFPETGIPARGKSLPGDLADLRSEGWKKINVCLRLSLDCHRHAVTFVNVMLQFLIIKHPKCIILLNK